MAILNTVAASEAKAKFPELLERTRNGEAFAITLHGHEIAKLVPSPHFSRDAVRKAIADLKVNRPFLNPIGMAPLRLKDLVQEGRR